MEQEMAQVIMGVMAQLLVEKAEIQLHQLTILKYRMHPHPQQM